MKTARNLAGVLIVILGVAGAAARATPAEEPKGARISIEPLSFDFGKALPNRTLSKEFVVKNVGSEDLEIERVTTTCGCTVADGYSKLVKPGGTTTLRVRLETRNYSGPVERKIAVKTNDPESAITELTVKATVEGEVPAQPARPGASKQ